MGKHHIDRRWNSFVQMWKYDRFWAVFYTAWILIIVLLVAMIVLVATSSSSSRGECTKWSTQTYTTYNPALKMNQIRTAPVCVAREAAE